MATPRTSIRQPLLVYASLFMVVLSLVVGLISGLSLVNASRRAYRRAARRTLLAMAPAGRPVTALSIDQNQQAVAELTLAVASSTVSAFGLTLDQIRHEAINPDITRNFVALPLDTPGREVYLVGLFDASVPVSIALVEIARMTPFVLLGALGCAGMLVILVGRILLPPLDALRRAAEETHIQADDGLTTDVLGVPAPNEILDIAHRFRRTVRQLNDERGVIEKQRDELERMQQNLIRASKLASVGRLAAGIAHEVGNPLAAVQGYLSLMKSGLPEKQAADVLRRSSTELTRIHQTIQKLLTYARTGEEHPVEAAPFDVQTA
ncbi:MAG: histidine kinase dimerization/phospho-acceptor domain-containing protein, partial [Myxococcota bacterium]